MPAQCRTAEGSPRKKMVRLSQPCRMARQAVKAGAARIAHACKMFGLGQSCDHSAPGWFAGLHYICWSGKTKDLHLASPRLGEALLLDDHEPYVHPGQKHLWVPIPLFESPYPPSDDGLNVALQRLSVRI